VSYKQYTSCSSPVNHVNLGWGAYVYATGFIAAIVAGIASSLNVYTLPILIGVDILLIAFCIWWLHNRLICLGNEECLIGVVAGTTPPQPLGKAGDDDFTMNVLLAPGPTDLKQPKEAYWNTPIQGYLVKENVAILNIGLHYAQDGGDLVHVQALHCEFEGSGIKDVLEWASAILALLVAALAVLLLLGPYGAILSVILWIIAAILTAIGGVTTLFDPLDPGDPTDVDQSLASLKKGDIVVVKGNWIYDSLHIGWNEIHAVHDCMIVNEIATDADGNWVWPPGLQTPGDVQTARDSCCAALTDANNAQVNGSWTDPANNWVIHPLVDGCKPPVIIV
jgi:hypothetical protein